MPKTTEEILNTPKIQKLIFDNYSDIENIMDFYAKTVNYKTNIYYHATGGYGESGVGRGLYLGKDWQVLEKFYNADNFGDIDMYEGEPSFLDLTEEKDFNTFKKNAEEKFGKLEKNEHLKKLCLEEEFDGIRYFDFCATGEEFVLYNTDKVKFVKQVKVGEKIESFI